MIHHFIFNTVQANEDGTCREVAYAVQGLDVESAMRNFLELQQGEIIFEGPNVEAVLVGVSLDAPPEEENSDDSTV